MIVKTSFQQREINDVQLGRGTVSIPGVKLNVYTFVIDGVLIDTGAKSLEKQFRSFFNKQDMDQAVITHFHEDHTGCASVLQKERQLPIQMKDIKIDYCKTKADYPLYRRIFWGKRPPFQATPLGNSFSSRRYRWEVIDTPGHAIDHVSFLNRDTGQLFTGDLYCQVKTKVVLREESVPTIIQSLQKVLAYDFEDVFCSHAGYLKEGRASLQRKLNYLLDLQQNILKLHKEGLSIHEINKSLFPKKYPISYFSLGEWDSINIIKSVVRDLS